MEAATPLSLVSDRIVHAQCLAAAMMASADPYYLEPLVRGPHADARAHARRQREAARSMREEAIRLRQRSTAGGHAA